MVHHDVSISVFVAPFRLLLTPALRYQLPQEMYHDDFVTKHHEIDEQAEKVMELINPCLSKFDEAFATIHYPPDRSKEGGEIILGNALSLVGVDNGTKNKLLELWKRGQVDQLRVDFGDWCKDSNKDSTDA
jgi:hypothetical protein